jgi:hypothetical protein
MREEAMFAVNQDKTDKSIGQVLRDLRGTILEQLVFIHDRLGPCNVFHWFQDEARRNAANRELSLLSDYCLDDIGARRPFDLRTDDLVKRLRAGG